MEIKELVDEYLAGLERADAARVLALFAPDGIVSSPLYGQLPAADFYPALFADTASSTLTLRATMTGDLEAASSQGGRTVISFWFDFDWVLADGTPAPFTVVDVAELDAAGRIARLHIVYDTAPLRDAFNQSKQSSAASVHS